MKEYLNDKNFLKQLDCENRKTQYIKITVLEFKSENPIATIEGKATGGNVNLNGNSNIRRTMSGSILVDEDGVYDLRYSENRTYYNITEVENLISLNKKVKVEIGFVNTLSYLGEKYYSNYNIIWIPLGVYVIKNANINKTNGGIKISLTMNDKTSLLNGDIGGLLPAATIFSESELFGIDNKFFETKQVLIKNIIKNLVIDFGGEKPENVIINDIPDTIRKAMKWMGKKPLYAYNLGEQRFFSLVDPRQNYEVTEFKKYETNMDIGYVLEPFHYPGKLECNAGDSIATVLDKIKNTLGNYEWFYDIYGKFHFQEKKNYLNNTFKPKEKTDLNNLLYLPIMNLSKDVYTFDEKNRHLLTGVSNNPQYQNIKNDFIIWGSTQDASGTKKPIRYHLVFDSKPKVDKNKLRFALTYEDFKGFQQTIILIEEKNLEYNTEPKDKKKYYLNDKHLIHWDEELQVFREFPDLAKNLCYLKTDDWRTELYFLGLEKIGESFANNYYAAELNTEWPKIYNVKSELIGINNDDGYPIYNGGYRDIPLNQYEYFLDFLDSETGTNSSPSQFSVAAIGRRTKIGPNTSANCIFTQQETKAENVIFIQADGSTTDDYSDFQKGDYNGYNIIQISEEIFENLSLGGNENSAYDKVKELLTLHSIYNETITLNTIPIYYLEPNTRIHIEDNDVAINGDYIINSISLPLGIGTSNVSCTRCLEKTF